MINRDSKTYPCRPNAGISLPHKPWWWRRHSRPQGREDLDATTPVRQYQCNDLVPWYVSNVSIIFDAPCLFIHHLLCVLLHFVTFYAFSGTNLLKRRHSASSLFSVIFVFQKSYTGNILGIGRNKSQTSYFSRHESKSEDEIEEGQGPATP
jgi:hypothetical protein